MGYAKQRMIEQQEQGWDFVADEFHVCSECFDDVAIRRFIEQRADEKQCSYCNRTSAEPISSSMNSVLEFIGNGVNSSFEDPANSLPVEGGEYIFDTMNIDEVLHEVGWPTQSDSVADEIRNAFGDRAWVRKNFFGLRQDEQLRYGWDDFVRAVKHRTRYLFADRCSVKTSLTDDTDRIPPHQMLSAIGKVIEEVELVGEVKAGARWYRARVHKVTERFTMASELGTVPLKQAIFSNRMSPAGIPMFYGADDVATAISETYMAHPKKTVAATIGVFETAREMPVLDLSKLPDVPSFFDGEMRHLRPAISFLHDFVADLTKPIKKDGREHIEYVPT